MRVTQYIIFIENGQILSKKNQIHREPFLRHPLFVSFQKLLHMNMIPEDTNEVSWLRAEVARYKSENERLIKNIAAYRDFINVIVYQADQVLNLQKIYFRTRMNYDKEQSIKWEVRLRLTIDKAKKKNYGLTPPPSYDVQQGKLL